MPIENRDPELHQYSCNDILEWAVRGCCRLEDCSSRRATINRNTRILHYRKTIREQILNYGRDIEIDPENSRRPLRGGEGDVGGDVDVVQTVHEKHDGSGTTGRRVLFIRKRTRLTARRTRTFGHRSSSSRKCPTIAVSVDEMSRYSTYRYRPRLLQRTDPSNVSWIHSDSDAHLIFIIIFSSHIMLDYTSHGWARGRVHL